MIKLLRGKNFMTQLAQSSDTCFNGLTGQIKYVVMFWILKD